MQTYVQQIDWTIINEMASGVQGIGERSESAFGMLESELGKIDRIATVVEVINVDAASASSSSAEAAKQAKSAKSQVTTVQGSVQQLKTAVGEGETDTAMTILERVKSEMATLKNEVQAMTVKMPSFGPLYDRMDEMASDINELANRQGVEDVIKILERGEDGEDGMIDRDRIRNMQNEIEELKATLELVRQLADRAANEPVITTWMESE